MTQKAVLLLLFPSNVTRLTPQRRADLSTVLLEARTAKGWNREVAAEMASDALRRASEEETEASPEERAFWASFEVTHHNIQGLENCPASPLSTMERRSCLLGLTLALGLDRAKINRLAGGV